MSTPSTPDNPFGGQQYPPPPPPPSAPYGGNGGGVPQQNQKALWSLILGIAGLVCCGLFTGIPAWIIGRQAKAEIAASAGTQTGEGMAKAGVILGIISVVLSVLGLLLWVVIFLVAGTSGLEEFSTV